MIVHSKSEKSRKDFFEPLRQSRFKVCSLKREKGKQMARTMQELDAHIKVQGEWIAELEKEIARRRFIIRSLMMEQGQLPMGYVISFVASGRIMKYDPTFRCRRKALMRMDRGIFKYLTKTGGHGVVALSDRTLEVRLGTRRGWPGNQMDWRQVRMHHGETKEFGNLLVHYAATCADVFAFISQNHFGKWYW